MAIDFFDTEVRRIQEEFNEVFAKRTVCDVAARNICIMSIACIMCSAQRINASKNKQAVRTEIQKFMHKKGVIERFLKSQKTPTERRQDAKSGMHNSKRA